MLKGLSLRHIINYARESWRKLPDKRNQNNNNLQYSIVDIALFALSVFVTQAPSFLAYQRDMKRRKGKSNAGSLFKIKRIPGSQQVRNIMDSADPMNWGSIYYAIIGKLKRSDYLRAFQGYANTELVSFDGFNFHSSMSIDCDQCNSRRDCNGESHYYHSAITPVIMHPEQAYVLPLPPEFIVPQDGHKKQDCERVAVKRWLETHTTRLKAKCRTYLGDDLYSNQPLCQLIDTKYKQYFIFVCKPDSHKTLYSWVEGMEKGGKLETKQTRKWNGRHGEIWKYRFATQVPLKAGDDGMRVNWVELTIIHEDTGKQIYKNSWVTNHAVDANCVAGIAKAGRRRWKIENENNNVLTTKGYHAKHNFGHGEEHLANTLLALNILAFLIHTVQDITHQLYRELRQESGRRDTFFGDIQTLTRYLSFKSWDSLWKFMAEGLELETWPRWGKR